MSDEKILIVDDEQNIVELIKFNLESSGYNVLCAYNGQDAVDIAKKEQPSLILLDLMLPVKDGLEVCKEIRRDILISNTPIIMLTAKCEELDKILGLELGADDYITKPFSVRELIARVKAILRRTQYSNNNHNSFTIQNLSIDFSKHEVKKDGAIVDLTLKEFELLEHLVKNRGKVLTRDVLLDKIWGYEYIGETRTVDVHIRHLRKKIEDDDSKPKLIETIRGIGYRFSEH
ncbi:MAG: response regulator transcription factor [Inconstantimicrobium porci]|uniref:Stage 0 sporulation protein A homolog n=1 Tax=Inconstantimicrobium porci TaxID=2652291 RepID=A0A7X2MW75_9CLOT|nr:response regulator transcription factor [Inconstantimicrobium porci]MDD6772188.1 response regulator transcription factor [Inconstantimicrobium porci]MDY5913159.1 response regulator transcription factor [Inconstantimicrobium porci]MSR90206.1 response regulator transcription factor [Inconstantimicrobium porci]